MNIKYQAAILLAALSGVGGCVQDLGDNAQQAAQQALDTAILQFVTDFATMSLDGLFAGAGL